MTAPVRTSRDDRGVFTITLADAENRNALSRRLLRGLAEAIDEADRDDAIRVVVLTNEGPVFCAGADLSERSQPTDDDPAGTPDMAGLFGRIRVSRKPWVGRIAGHTVAGGIGLAAACDISVIHDDAKLGFTEARIGVAPAVISVICLPKMRAADAAETFLRADRFSGAKAAELGLINHAVPADQLDATVSLIVDDLLEGSPNALAACKQLMAEVPTMPLTDALRWAGGLSASLFASPEAAEGMSAYLHKRPPAWSPRATGPDRN